MQVSRWPGRWRVYRSTRTGHYTWLGVRSDKKAMTENEALRRLSIFWTGRKWSKPLYLTAREFSYARNKRFFKWATGL